VAACIDDVTVAFFLWHGTSGKKQKTAVKRRADIRGRALWVGDEHPCDFLRMYTVLPCHECALRTSQMLRRRYTVFRSPRIHAFFIPLQKSPHEPRAAHDQAIEQTRPGDLPNNQGARRGA